MSSERTGQFQLKGAKALKGMNRNSDRKLTLMSAASTGLKRPVVI